MGNLIRWLKLGRALQKLGRQIEKEVRMGYSPWKTVLKGAASFAKTSVGIAAPVLLAYWADPENVEKALDAVGPSGVAWAPVVTMIITIIVNFAKNRKK